MEKRQSLTPRLVVRDAHAAITFYQRALGAQELERVDDEHGKLVHCALRLGDTVFALTEERLDYNMAPPTLSGSAVILIASVDDPDAVASALVAGGGSIVFPVRDHEYGYREGRVRDPYGHLWIVSRPLAESGASGT